MRGKFLKGMTTGALIGAAAGMMLMPQFDRNTKKKIKRTARYVRSTAEDAYGNMRDWVK